MRWLVVLGVWTLLVWATRIDNVLGEEGLTAAGRAARLALAGSFTLAGAVLLAVAWRARGRVLTRAEARAVEVIAAWTVGVWLVRGVQIALADHAVAFVAVHTLLAVVSIGLAVVTVRTTTMPVRHGTAGHRRAEVDLAP